MASMVCTVSRRLSPFFTDDVPTVKAWCRRRRRLAAVSNESRVRVESSKKSDTTVLPRRAGTFGIYRAAAPRRRRRSGRASPRCPSAAGLPRRSSEVVDGSMVPHCASPPVGSTQLGTPSSPPSTSSRRTSTSRRAGGQVLAHDSRRGWAARGGPGRSAPPAARPGAGRVRQGVEGGPHGAAGEQHVVDQHHDLAGQIAGDLGGGLGQRPGACRCRRGRRPRRACPTGTAASRSASRSLAMRRPARRRRSGGRRARRRRARGCAR